MKYTPEFDGIRALAVLAVMAFHAKVPGFTGGFFGVDVFFVLSGFLITRILMAEHEANGRIAVSAFYVRRLKRLYPALLAMLAAYLIIAPQVFPQFAMAVHVKDALMSAFYLSDYAQLLGGKPILLGHTWSLAIEEQFYLVWPLLLIVLLKLPRRAALFIVVALAAAATLWRAANVLAPESDWRFIYNRFDTHASGLLIGCAAALSAIHLRSRWAVYGFAGVLGAMLHFSFDYASTAVIGFTIVEIAAAVVILTRPPWLAARPLVWTGKLSYGLYLWHFPIMYGMRQLGYGWPETAAIGGGAALLAAYLSYTWVECWFRQPRDAGPVTKPATATA